MFLAPIVSARSLYDHCIAIHLISSDSISAHRAKDRPERGGGDRQRQRVDRSVRGHGRAVSPRQLRGLYARHLRHVRERAPGRDSSGGQRQPPAVGRDTAERSLQVLRLPETVLEIPKFVYTYL